MSANNQLIIKKKGKKWIIREVDADTGKSYADVGDDIPSLEDAIRAAEFYMEDNEIEYGYKVILPKHE